MDPSEQTAGASGHTWYPVVLKFEDQQVGLHLAMIGSINDEILNVEELALSVIDYLTAEYPGTLEKRFGFEGMTDRVEILGEIARVRGCLKKGK